MLLLVYTDCVAKCKKYCEDSDYFQNEAARLSVCVLLYLHCFHSASVLTSIFKRPDIIVSCREN